MRKLVVPGELLAEKILRLPDAIVENGKTYATVIGIFDDEKGTFIPLEGLWYPKTGERVIGIIDAARLNTMDVNLHSPYKGIIISKYSAEPIDNGDVIEATVKELDKTGTIVLTMPRKLRGGKTVYLKPSKIPRVIGSGNTMVKQINIGTGSNIVVGMNGLIWISGGNTDLATEAIKQIQEEAHVSGLTDRIAGMMKNNSSSKQVKV